jgi:AAA-like domain/TIR domain
MAHAFISYASKDHAVASAIRSALAMAEVSCWMAPDDITPGQPYAAALTNAIKESRALILVFSTHANESEHVPREVERAVHLGIPIVPFRIEKVEPSSSLEHFISYVHWLDASNPPQKDDLERLAEAVKKWVGAKEKAAGPGPAKPESVKQTTPPLRVALLYKRHVKTDEALMKWLEGAFASRGYQVFIDRHLGIGVEWAKELDRRIRESDAVVPLLSPASAQSEMLAGELQIAQEEAQRRHGKPCILPVRVNFEGQLPSEIGGVLNRLQYFLWKNPQDNASLLVELVSAMEKPPVEQARVAPPTGVLPLHSRYYVDRPVDREMQAAVSRQDSVVRIRGARQVGKTSLLARALEQARAPGTRVVMTDFQQLNASDLESVETLFRTLGEWIADELKLDIPIDQFWSSRRNPSRRFNQFICQEVLGRIDEPLVWAMDEVDRLFPCPFRSEVFGLFRSWHNARATEPTRPWRRLTLVIAYATEAHLLIDNLDQSPFNVGTSLVLEDFAPREVAELNRRYDSPLHTEAELESYCALVGGHPYLANRGFHEMVQKGLDLAAFKLLAERDDGIFNDHLHRLITLLSKDPGLCEVVRGVLRGQPKASTESFLRLRSAGVLAGDSVDEMRMRCQLYASYLKRHLL